MSDNIVRIPEVLNSVTLAAFKDQHKGVEVLQMPKPAGNLDIRNPRLLLQNSNGDVDVATQGYEYAIKTTTFIHAKVIEQLFYELLGHKISDFMPIEVGVGAFLEQIRRNFSVIHGGSFEDGLYGTATGRARKMVTDIGIYNQNIPLQMWRGGYEYNISEIQSMLQANNMNAVELKTKSIKKVFDLGLQETAFLGLVSNNSSFPGLLTNTTPTKNTATLIAGTALKDMTDTQLNAFASSVLGTYMSNAAATLTPTHFVIPLTDWLGLGSTMSETFPVKSKKEFLTEVFEGVCGPGFKILPLAYCDAARNATVLGSGSGINRYALYRYDSEVLVMDMPVPFSMLAPGTDNNFDWEAIAYAQFSGCNVLRPPLMLYIDASY